MKNLDRPGITPKFVAYPTEYALKLADQEWPYEVSDLDPNPVKIPPYQRKIVWDRKTIEDFLDSKAVLFGTVILAHSPKETPLVLLDGLQRFATSTAILNCLYSDILPNQPAGVKQHFERLVAETADKKPIFQHNDRELRNNTRTGIRESYAQLYDNVKLILQDEINKDSEEIAEKLIQTFVKKQIAIDTYYGFKNANEFTQTFININSKGLDLTQVDLLRSEIIQHAESMGWDAQDIDEVENRFTDVFQSGKIKAAKVLGKHLYDALQDENKSLVFKNWERLTKDDVDDLLDFIDKTYEASNEEGPDGNKKWPYLYENFQCGDIPFSIIVWFYYKKYHENGQDPDFLEGSVSTTDDLHYLLRAFYRRVVNSSMNRADTVASRFIQEKNPDKSQSMRDLAGEVNPAESDLDQTLDESWIRINLKKANTGKIRRIFNACLLPGRKAGHGGFHPLNYEDRKGWTIDYLIPKKKGTKAKEDNEQIDAITNKIPIRADIKKILKNKTCLDKIDPDGALVKISSHHPYVEWLATEHYDNHRGSETENSQNEHVMNSLECLSNASEPHIGEERLNKIIALLRERI